MLTLEKIKQEKDIRDLVNFSIVLIDKPTEWTSFDVVNKIRGIFGSFGIKKAGHFGTLDPNVTGLLPICLGDACKVQEYFMHRNKTYIGKMKIHQTITKTRLEEEMKKFLGKINQLPPVKSRVKRVIREREIIEFKLLSFDSKNNEAEFISRVEAGTYIRKLIHDLGESLGIGAQMTDLRRTEAGIFSEKNQEYTTLENLSKLVADKNYEELKKFLIPAEIISQFMECFEVTSEAITKIKNGSPLFKQMLVNSEDEKKIKKLTIPFCLVNNSQILEIAKITDQFENKDILAKPEVVIVK